MHSYSEPSRAILELPAFKSLLARQRRVSLSLTALMLLLYFGFILLIAYRKDVLAQPVAGHITLGLPLGLGLILVTVLLTGIYVRWANRAYDPAVEALRRELTAKAEEA